MPDRLDTIEVFVAVAELQSFAAAARKLNRTPAAVTRAIAALETRLQTRLLNRTTRSVALTDEGNRHLEACRRVVAAYTDLQGIETGSPEPHGLLTVTAPSAFGRLHLLPALARYMARHPRVEVRATLLDRVVSLVDEGVDVGIRLGPMPDSTLRAVAVGQVRRGVYASPAYLAAHGTPDTPAALASHRVISCTATTPIPDRWPLGSPPVRVHPRLVTNDTLAAADAAAAGLGPTCIVSYQADAHVHAGRLVRILDAFSPPPTPIHIVHPAGRFVPPRLRAFIDEVATDLRAAFTPPTRTPPA